MSKVAYTVFQAPPESDLRALLAAIEKGRDKAASAPTKRVLVDLMSLAQEPGQVESLLLSHHVGMHLAQLDRIAILIANRTGLGERVAQGLGVNMRVFTSRDEAVAWLEDDSPAPGY